MLRCRANGESVEAIQPDLIIPAGKRKGHSPSVASIYRALAEREKAQAYPEALAQAHVGFAALQVADDIPRPARPARPASAGPQTRSRRRKPSSASGSGPSHTRTRSEPDRRPHRTSRPAPPRPQRRPGLLQLPRPSTNPPRSTHGPVGAYLGRT
ncbi:MAG: hypothetical protein ACRDOE_02950, partial [Streptosporangiaceae bacterium]